LLLPAAAAEAPAASTAISPTASHLVVAIVPLQS
jgi:hypothetical protein